MNSQIYNLVSVFQVISLKININNQKDDTKIKSLESSMMELKEHYWRAYYYLLDYQKSDWKSGHESCILQHMEVLCEQYNLYDSRGRGFYFFSSVYSSQNTIPIILLSPWTLITTLIIVSTIIQMIQKFGKEFSLKAFGGKVAINEAQAVILLRIYNYSLNYINKTSFQQLIKKMIILSLQQCQQPSKYFNILLIASQLISQIYLQYTLESFGSQL
ncbi:unnamed protein product [Paramecium pentaurelia]|uniref:Transmembrane protein n=1 Tax=Paramecium pentaurelia TaxID=43138 RepID=A0A8S1U4N5_9CILI|nr:unnamed protein product [Paramecium pentaurelia]